MKMTLSTPASRASPAAALLHTLETLASTKDVAGTT